MSRTNHIISRKQRYSMYNAKLYWNECLLQMLLLAGSEISDMPLESVTVAKNWTKPLGMPR